MIVAVLLILLLHNLVQTCYFSIFSWCASVCILLFLRLCSYFYCCFSLACNHFLSITLYLSTFLSLSLPLFFLFVSISFLLPLLYFPFISPSLPLSACLSLPLSLSFSFSLSLSFYLSLCLSLSQSLHLCLVIFNSKVSVSLSHLRKMSLPEN